MLGFSWLWSEMLRPSVQKGHLEKKSVKYYFWRPFHFRRLFSKGVFLMPCCSFHVDFCCFILNFICLNVAHAAGVSHFLMWHHGHDPFAPFGNHHFLLARTSNLSKIRMNFPVWTHPSAWGRTLLFCVQFYCLGGMARDGRFNHLFNIWPQLSKVPPLACTTTCLVNMEVS